MKEKDEREKLKNLIKETIDEYDRKEGIRKLNQRMYSNREKMKKLYRDMRLYHEYSCLINEKILLIHNK